MNSMALALPLSVANPAAALYPDPPRTKRPGNGGLVPLRHATVDEWLIPTGEPLKEIAAGMVDAVEGNEMSTGSRERRRKEGRDRDSFVDLTSIVVANLARAVLIRPQPHGWMALRMGNRSHVASHQDHDVFGKQAPKLIYALEEMGFLAIHRPGMVGVRSGERYSIGPTDKLRDLVIAQSVTLDHFGRHPDENLLLLKFKFGTKAVQRSRLLSYPHTALTNRHRADLLTINTALASADIAFLDDPSGPAVDTRDRLLRRRFLASTETDFAFDKVGRLYGGFWQNMKRDRRHGIRLNGEPAADLDFKNMFIRLAYAMAGETAPEGDLYAVPGLEAYRSGVKLLVNALFWDPTKRRQNLPKGKGEQGEDDEEDGRTNIGVGVGTDEDARQNPNGEAASVDYRFPADWTCQRMLSAIRERHPRIKHLFGTGIGGRLMHMESEVMVRVLLDLIGKGIAPLPLHDGLMVAQSVKGTAVQAMKRGARDVAGVDLPIEEKSL